MTTRRYNASFSLNKELIAWLDELDQQGENKSAVVRRALTFYKDLGQVLDLEKLSQNLKSLPMMVETLIRLEQTIDSMDQKLSQGSQSAGPQEESPSEPSKTELLDLMSQIDSIL